MLRVRRDVAGVGDLVNRQTHELLAAAPDDLAEFVVHHEEAALFIDVRDAGGRLFQAGAEALLVFLLRRGRVIARRHIETKPQGAVPLTGDVAQIGLAPFDVDDFSGFGIASGRFFADPESREIGKVLADYFASRIFEELFGCRAP